MTTRERYLSWTCWLLRIAVFLPLYAQATESDSQAKLLQTVQQRLTLASHLIERMPIDRKAAFDEQLEALQTRFLQQPDDMLADDANDFLKKVMVDYREGVTRSSDVDEEQHRRRYEQKRTELSSFREAYDALVEERGDEARKVLDEPAFLGRLGRSRELAAKAKYEDAYAVADGAYHQLITALKKLRDNETVEYRLEFATPDDEYAYDNRRFNSQKMLLDMVVAEKNPSPDSMKLIDAFVAEASSKMNKAEQLADAGKMDDAIAQQEGAIEALTKAMRVAGVYF